MKYSFKKYDLDNVPEALFNSPVHKSVFTTKEWIQYIAEDSGAEPIIVEIDCENRVVGFFSCLLFKKFGIKIIASPFDGWSTCYMGFDLIADDDRFDIIPQLKEYLFKELKCSYMEITDREISTESAKAHGYKCMSVETLELSVDTTDEGLFKVFKQDCRNFIRQFERRGASIEVAQPDDKFAEEYYLQLEDVFAKQGLVPTYSLDKVKCLLRHMKDTENVLCLRVRDPEGNSIATSIFFGYHEKFFFWGGASYRSGQHYRPNEYMLWTAIRYWREKGAKTFDMVGNRDYKKKFGSHEEKYAMIFVTKYPILIFLRNMAKKMYFLLIKIEGFFTGKK